MNDIGFVKEPIAIPDVDYRITMLRMERAMRKSPGFKPGDFYPIVNTFAHGMYIRQITVPAGHLILTYIHKQSHPYFLLQGEVTVIQEEGYKHIKAPYSYITPAGTQRLCFCHTETVWTTVHLNLTNERDIDKIEEDIYACHYNELTKDVKEEVVCQVH
jgi:hypothetical protein